MNRPTLRRDERGHCDYQETLIATIPRGEENNPEELRIMVQRVRRLGEPNWSSPFLTISKWYKGSADSGQWRPTGNTVWLRPSDFEAVREAMNVCITSNRDFARAASAAPRAGAKLRDQLIDSGAIRPRAAR